MDSGVRNIEWVRGQRFRVIHDDFARAPDLSSFGEGMRRVFEIGLLFAGARGGVLLIDEFENAIHTELLSKFTGLVRKLGEQFEVQVFLTTHSKEAVDAWVMNGEDASGIVGYALGDRPDAPRVQRFDGKQLRDLHEGSRLRPARRAMKAVLVFVEGSQDIAFVQRSLRALGECRQLDDAISKLPSPFGMGRTARTKMSGGCLLLQRLKDYELKDPSLAEAADLPRPSFRAALENAKSRTIFFLVRTDGKVPNGDRWKGTSHTHG